MAEVQGIPIDDDGGEQVEPGNTVVLALGGTVADFALASDPQGVLQRMVRLALVEADLGAALHNTVDAIDGRTKVNTSSDIELTI